MKRNDGFSIVQIIITMALFSGIILCGFKLLKAQTKIGKSSQGYLESLHIVDEIKTILSDRRSCALTLEGKSASLDSVKNIFSLRDKSHSSIEYMIQNLGKPFYGASRLFITKMEINGHSRALNLSKGLSLLTMSFGHVAKEDELYSFKIPIHVEIDKENKIKSCFSLPGINGENIDDSSSAAWALKQEQGNQANAQILYSRNKSVMIGKLKKLREASLLIKGSLKVGNSNICEVRSFGLLSYDAQRDVLKWCNEYGQWENLRSSAALISQYKDYSSVHREADKKIVITESKFKFCQVRQAKLSAGVCMVRAVEVEKSSTHWELISKYLRGKSVECDFRCFN